MTTRLKWEVGVFLVVVEVAKVSSHDLRVELKSRVPSWLYAVNMEMVNPV